MYMRSLNQQILKSTSGQMVHTLQNRNRHVWWARALFGQLYSWLY